LLERRPAAGVDVICSNCAMPQKFAQEVWASQVAVVCWLCRSAVLERLDEC
jgi:hypothetical protein